MRCQNCDQNEATIHLYANVGGHRKQIDYCQNCYQKMKNQMSNTVNNGPKDPFGFNNLDELFKQLSQQMQQANNQEPQTPPTQSGGGNNFFNGDNRPNHPSLVPTSPNKHETVRLIL